MTGYVDGVKNARIQQTVTSDGVEYKVTSVGDKCFFNYTGLTSIIIPEGVTSLGISSFYGCTGLTSVTLPETVTSIESICFYKCTALTNINIPKGITLLPYSCFSRCEKLTSITLPEGLIKLDDECFEYCTALTSINIPESVTSIGNSCFYYCGNLTGVTLPEGITSLPYKCFYGCYGLTSITIPEGVTSLGERCFAGCYYLTSITLPSTITSIGTECFYFVARDYGSICKLYIDDNFDTSLLGTADGSTYSIGGGTFVVPAQSIKLSSDKLFAIKGLPFDTVKVTFVPAAANNKNFVLTSGNTSVVSIENNDSIVLAGAGETDVRYDAADGYGASDVCHVTVKLQTDSVKTDVSQKDFLVGQTFTPTVTIYPAEAVQKFKVSSSNPAVATVDSTGTITTLALGETDIRYDSYENSKVYAQVKVRVFEKTGSLALDNNQQVLLVGNTYRPTFSITPAEANQQPLGTSSDEQVATVDSTGTVTAVAPGEADIHYEAFDNSDLTASLHVTVYSPADTIELGEKELHLLINDQHKMKVSVLPQTAMQKWTAVGSDSAVAVVSEDGVIVAKGWGESDITFEAADGTKKAAVCHVYVTYPTDSLQLSTTRLNINPGKVFNAQQVTYYPDNCRKDLNYTSSNEQVATVDSLTGTITAVAAGEADVRYEAKDGTGKYAVCHVKVWPLTESLTPSSTTLALKMGEEYNQQTVAILPSGAYPKLKMTSQDDSVATVDENGVIKAVGLGVTNIVYQAMDSSSVQTMCQVRVILQDSAYYAINSKETWEKFCALIAGGYTTINAKLTDDVTLDSLSSMAGLNAQRYAGRFDGQGHTLTVNYIGTGQATAPFNIVQGAVIENLKTAGTIRQTGTTNPKPQSHASGLVGGAFGVTINNCEVAVAISYTLAGDHHSGGFVGHGEGSVIMMNNCKFSGSFNGPEGGQISGIAGLVGWSAGSGSSFTNCYVGGTYTNIVDVHPLVYTSNNVTITSTNDYFFLDTIGVSTWRTKGNPTKVTADEVKSGSVAYALQHGTGAQYWSQKLPDETEPMLAFSDSVTVNKVEFVYNDTTKYDRYANTGGTIIGGVPVLSAKDALGSDYNGSNYYEMTYTPEFTDSTVVTGDSFVQLGFKSSAFTINSKETWEKFCELVNGGSNLLNAKMTADVTDSVATMAGISALQYQGTFDGQGHTLTVNLSGDQYVAPFTYTNHATIKNLKVTGTIAATGKYAAGIVSNVVAGAVTTISDCESNVTINSTVSGDGTNGGIVAVTSNNGYVAISNCAFTGVMNGAATNSNGGIIGWAGSGAAKSSITNCLVAATFNSGTSGSATFTRNPSKVTVTNCYYLNAYGTGQGTQATKEQLSSGETAYLLQGSQDLLHWGMTFGSDAMPQLTSDSTKKVCGVKFTMNGTAVDTLYANPGGNVVGKIPGFTELKSFISNFYDDYYYKFTFFPEFSASTVVDSDMVVTVAYTEDEYCYINTRDDWNTFAEYVKTMPSARAQLDADLDISGLKAIGSEAVPFCGKFLGEEHTITVNGTIESDSWIAPFGATDNAYIENLAVDGVMSIDNTDDSINAAGFIGHAKEYTRMVNCQSSIQITNKTKGIVSGFIGTASESDDNPMSLQCLAFLGSLEGNKGGVFVGDANSSVDVELCLAVPTKISLSSGYIFGGDKAKLDACYYNGCGNLTAENSAIEVTDEQFKNGEVAYKLQSEYTVFPAWAFSLGKGTMLQSFAHPDESENYIYYISNRYLAYRWHCDDYKLTDSEAYQNSYVDFAAEKVSYRRSLTEGRRYTWYQPYSVSMSEDLPFKAYKLTGYSNGNAIFSELADSDTLAAYTPYLIMMNESVNTISYQKETVVKHHADNDSTVQTDGLKMTGTVVNISNGEASNLGAYIMQNDNSWRRVMADQDATAYIPPFRAYLTSPAAGAKIGSVFTDGTTTGVENIILQDNDGTTHIYDLRGMDRGTDFDSLPTGVYIRGGKKVVKR